LSLYSKKINNVTFNDIRSFVDIGLREDVRLDYKEDFPSNLAKIVTAFSNTAGGIVLIGVRASRDTNQPEVITGVPLIVGLEEKVTNITMSNIRPPVSPEVKICPYKSNANLAADDRAVIIVRVSESNIAPHSETSNNSIWVRNHNVCNQASLDIIEKLLEKRDRRNSLIEKIQKEANEILITAPAGFPTFEGQKRYFSIALSPLYPLSITFNKSKDDFLSLTTFDM